ncbi:MAG: SCP2 sterol-binding domain-containing protein [Chloroflexi bacterium]|nr:SCP2 sterol-binding domain-containing protein [Chloroflexota bacterium]MBU1751197.1 SCP2 sterol-binding domain-containing protein [Chloroflexota bacterium]MBU1878616.1 SCP2 sterol-binding domain-containing protein [Chloroflexota bacterium]
MAIPFPSDEWIKALCAELNASASYREAAKTWEGDFIFVVEPAGNLKETVYLYMDLWHGECRGAYQLASVDERDAAFRMSAPANTWREVIEARLDPLKGLMVRKLKLKGNMSMIMRSVKAAQELVKCCTQVDTTFTADC